MSNVTKGVYRRLYSTTLINLIGDAIAQVALPLAFLYATGSIALAATLAAATLTTQLVLTMPLAAIADRLPRRPIVIGGYIIEAICLAILGIFLYVGFAQPLVFIAIGSLRGAASQFGVAASAGYVPQLLGRDALLHYHSRVETVEGVAAIGGPSVAGGIVGLLGGPLALFVPAVMSGANALIYRALPPRPTVASSATSSGKSGIFRAILPDIYEGMAYIARSRTLIAAQLVQVALGATTAGYIYGVVVHLKSDLGLPAWLVGFILASSGVGGIIASLTLERFVPIGGYKLVMSLSLAGVGIILATFAFIHNLFFLSFGLFALDFFWVGLFIYVGTLSQYVTDDEHLARVDSVETLSFYGASALSTFFAGLVIPNHGVAIYLSVISTTVLPAFVMLLSFPAYNTKQTQD
ncbi:MFS transporter [Arcanobacterium pinnipediorum]|uniref:MFS transporter n=1 Tax=Arcanobacterium pinnipediorum TaxID=1503041 RepID=A0ABY5AH62_9ACTO|nr:MFS transporter [Arcanobacterium pinnipediorum]USR79258.1 MFS transporter [Arcanobacterium pinnipediorum]